MSAGNTGYGIPTLPSRVGMKDCFLDTLFSLGKACLVSEETLTRPYIYNTPFSTRCQAKKIPYDGDGA